MKNAQFFILLIGLLAINSSALADKAIFAGGCFWCIESDFEKLEGVNEAISGFTGGTIKNPIYNGNHRGHYEAVEVDYDPTKTLRLLVNYAYQKSEDDETNDDVGEAPNHQVYGRSEWEFITNWHFDTQVNWVGEQKRVSGDARSPVDDYTTVDITLRKTAAWKTLELKLSVRNMFDEAVYEASPAGAPTSIPGDFPMAGRSVYGEVSYTF